MAEVFREAKLMVTPGMVAMGDGEVEDWALERWEDMLDDRLPGNIQAFS